MTVDGSVISGNSARESGVAIFFVSNDRTETPQIDRSTLRGNPNACYPGVFFLGQGQPAVTASALS